MAHGGDDARLLQELRLHSNADCAQFCPVDEFAVDDDDGDEDAATAVRASASAAKEWLAVATYELDEATRERSGSLMLYTMGQGEIGGGEGAADGQGEGEEEEEDEEEERPRRRWRRPQKKQKLALSARLDGLPGVFDAQWLRLPAGWRRGCSSSSRAEWGVSLALSDGRVVVLAVQEEEEVTGGKADGGSEESESGKRSSSSLRLEQVAEWQAIRGPEGLEDDATKRMALMVAWDHHRTQRAAVSGSGGTVAVMEDARGEAAAAASAGSASGPWSEWRAHDLEAWAVAFDPWRPPALYTGSDDASLKLWDLRMARRSSGGGSGSGSEGAATATGAAASPALLLCDKRTHSAGVTCVSPHPSRQHILATGSYDEKARLWDARRPRSPLAELDVGGGAWRLQWQPARRGEGDNENGNGNGNGDLILAACMYNGFAVLRATGLDGEGGGGKEGGLEVAGRMGAPHESIAYGCDWWRSGRRRGKESVVATASFYDRRLCLWEVDHTSSSSSSFSPSR